MDLENPEPVTEDGTTKRVREENEEENNGVSKKLKVEDDKSVEEVRMEKIEEDNENGEEEKGKEEDPKKTDEPVSLGPKTFGSCTELFEYFCKLLHHRPSNVQVNKSESVKKSKHKMVANLTTNLSQGGQSLLRGLTNCNGSCLPKSQAIL
ncbi:protein EMBRYO DEFECTIVE 514-like isoform X2 [Amaranthus tricolor]|uniref:protein EMBRYO DEFECTIVE 514-like isoform X2 n=1 Tax=Amaranthus tricolor TaxID=29722 RepID=UPI00258E2EB3|nr:protein EMBRYO DEFECTIVE 514-like isoform X2 [Amaranthus tricolor]